MTRARLFQFALLWLIVSAMVWLTTIWRWQSQGADVTTGDIALQLLLLPLALAAVLAGALWAIGLARKKAAKPVAPRNASVAASQGAPGSASLSSPQLSPTVVDPALACAVVLAEHVNLAAGSDAAQARDNLAVAAVRPGLDPELQDVDGMPVFAGRHPELDLADWLDRDQAPAQRWPEETTRTLALLEPVLHQALDSLLTHAGPDAPGWLAWHARQRQSSAAARSQALPPTESGQPSYLSGVARPEAPAAQLARKAQAPTLHVRLVLPAWAPEVREAAVGWVKAQCGALLDWVEGMSARGVVWQVEPLAQNEDLWTEVDQTLVRWQREARPELLLLLAADSALSPEVIERMQARGELFTAQHQVGRMPGEGAAALLLGTSHWLGLAAGEVVPPASVVDADGGAATDATVALAAAVRLWRPVAARRDKSADAHGRAGHQTLTGLLKQVQHLHAPTPQVLHIVADADHRASRTAELYESVSDVLPDADPMLAVTRVGQGCGDLGSAGALVPTALACAWLRAAEPAPAPDPAADPQDTQDPHTWQSAPMALAAHVQASHQRVLVPLSTWHRVPQPVEAGAPQALAA